MLTHQAWPDGPNRIDRQLRPLRRGRQGWATIDISGAVEFWDITNREDYHVVEAQQQGTRSRSWVAGRYSNQEASVHAFDIMVADRYANDGIAHRPRLAHRVGERPPPRHRASSVPPSRPRPPKRTAESPAPVQRVMR